MANAFGSIHRLAHYCLDLAELMETDRVVPVVIFYLDFRYLSCALGELSYEHYRHSDNLVVRLNLPNMQYSARCKVAVYAQAVRGLTTLEPDPEKQLKYLDFIDIYAALDDNERDEYQRDYPDEAQTMSRFAECFHEKGMQQGMQQSKHQGEALILERQLRLKFGTLHPTRYGAGSSKPTSGTLLEWSERILTASRLDEILH